MKLLILEVNCLQQNIMHYIRVACTAKHTLIFYGIFITDALCLHVTIKKMLKCEFCLI